jgi:hypothetical protein
MASRRQPGCKNLALLAEQLHTSTPLGVSKKALIGLVDSLRDSYDMSKFLCWNASCTHHHPAGAQGRIFRSLLEFTQSLRHDVAVDFDGVDTSMTLAQFAALNKMFVEMFERHESAIFNVANGLTQLPGVCLKASDALVEVERTFSDGTWCPLLFQQKSYKVSGEALHFADMVFPVIDYGAFPEPLVTLCPLSVMALFHSNLMPASDVIKALPATWPSFQQASEADGFHTTCGLLYSGVQFNKQLFLHYSTVSYSSCYVDTFTYEALQLENTMTATRDSWAAGHFRFLSGRRRNAGSEVQRG